MISAEVQEKLALFACLNNWSVSHPLDMDRFWDFVVSAFQHGDLEIDSEDMRTVIEPEYNISDHKLGELIALYQNGINLLRVYNKSKIY